MTTNYSGVIGRSLTVRTMTGWLKVRVTTKEPKVDRSVNRTDLPESAS